MGLGSADLVLVGQPGRVRVEFGQCGGVAACCTVSADGRAVMVGTDGRWHRVITDGIRSEDVELLKVGAVEYEADLA